jgi:hypothetical protein
MMPRLRRRRRRRRKRKDEHQWANLHEGKTAKIG